MDQTILYDSIKFWYLTRYESYDQLLVLNPWTGGHSDVRKNTHTFAKLIFLDFVTFVRKILYFQLVLSHLSTFLAYIITSYDKELRFKQKSEFHEKNLLPLFYYDKGIYRASQKKKRQI